MLTLSRLFAVLLTCLALPALAGDYALRPGDKLRVEVLQQSDLNRTVLVLPDGSFTFPMVGRVAAQGQSVTSVQAALRQGLAPNFVAPPDVYVSVTSLAQRPRQAATRSRSPAPRAAVNQQNRIAVYAMGELNRPGRLEVAPGTTLLQFIAQAGGMTPFAADKRLRVQRTNKETGQTQIVTVNMRSVMAGRASPIGALADGDVIIVPERRLFE